jgi:hypothetical protein
MCCNRVDWINMTHGNESGYQESGKFLGKLNNFIVYRRTLFLVARYQSTSDGLPTSEASVPSADPQVKSRIRVGGGAVS